MMPYRRRRTRSKREAMRRFVPRRLDGVDEPQPVHAMGRTIASSFWGKAWCDHLEKFSDYENRLPRGRTYVRRGSVWHLDVGSGRIEARVRGTDLYRVVVDIDPVAPAVWRAVEDRSRGQIGSILELLEGRLSDRVMAVVCDRDEGLFPTPREIHLSCSCPDWAVMCKHVAAVLYGVGHRLDERPELLFTLRGVDASELITAQVAVPTGRVEVDGLLDDGSLEEIFGIQLGESVESVAAHRSASALPVGAQAEEGRPSGGVPADGKRGQVNPRRRSGVRKAPALTGTTVSRARREDGLSVAEFAWALGVSEATVRRWEETRGPLKLRARTRKVLEEWMEEG